MEKKSFGTSQREKNKALTKLTTKIKGKKMKRVIKYKAKNNNKAVDLRLAIDTKFLTKDEIEDFKNKVQDAAFKLLNEFFYVSEIK